MPYEAPWQAVTKWLQMSDEETEEILPNLRSVPTSMLLEKEVFKSNGPLTGHNKCIGDGNFVVCNPTEKRR